QDDNVTADLLGSSDGVQGGRLELLIVVVSNNENTHLDHLRFVLQFVNQFAHALDLDARLAGSRRFDLDGGQTRLNVNAQIGGADGIQGLLLGLHDVGQGSVAGLVQTQVGGDHRRQGQSHGGQTAVDFTGNVDLVAFD